MLYSWCNAGSGHSAAAGGSPTIIFHLQKSGDNSVHLHRQVWQSHGVITVVTPCSFGKTCHFSLQDETRLSLSWKTIYLWNVCELLRELQISLKSCIWSSQVFCSKSPAIFLNVFFSARGTEKSPFFLILTYLTFMMTTFAKLPTINGFFCSKCLIHIWRINFSERINIRHT